MRVLAFVLLTIGCAMQTRAEQPPSVAENRVATSIEFALGHAWSIEFKPDGSVHAQYGSLPGDEADLPAGTVDFKSLVSCTRTLRASAGRSGRSQVIVYDGTDASRTAFYLRDDTLYVYLLSSFAAMWTPRCPSDRFEKLINAHPLSLPLPNNG